VLITSPNAAHAAGARAAKPASATFSFGTEGLRICTSGCPEQGTTGPIT
jgi:hypothetical protein